MLNGGASSTVQVRNISEFGAALGVATPVGIPEKFTLIMGEAMRGDHATWYGDRRERLVLDSNEGGWYG